MIIDLLARCVPAVLTLLSTGSEAPVLPLVTWEEVAFRPDRYADELSRMVIQVRDLEADWEPYLTRFAPASYLAVNGWSDAQLPWVRADYDAPRAGLFVRRGTRAARRLAAAEPHERFVVACVVRSRFLGRPWIEVTAVRRTREYIPEGSILHAVQGIELLERDAIPLATDQFERALAAPLPDHAREALEVLLERCLRRTSL